MMLTKQQKVCCVTFDDEQKQPAIFEKQ